MTQLWKKFKHLFEKMLHLSVVGCLIVLFEQLFEYLPQGCTAVKRKRASTMSALTINLFGPTTSGKSSVNQGFLANPSGGLTRRGRLARTIVVLSLSVVMVAGFAATSGANQEAPVASAAPSYSVVVVAPGETLWSVAAAYASGDVQGFVTQIREINNLKGYDLQAGQRLRVPLGK